MPNRWGNITQCFPGYRRIKQGILVIPESKSWFLSKLSVSPSTQPELQLFCLLLPLVVFLFPQWHTLIFTLLSLNSSCLCSLPPAQYIPLLTFCQTSIYLYSLALQLPTSHPLPPLLKFLGSNYSSWMHFPSFSPEFLWSRGKNLITESLPYSCLSLVSALPWWYDMHTHNSSLCIQMDVIVLCFLVTPITKNSPVSQFLPSLLWESWPDLSLPTKARELVPALGREGPTPHQSRDEPTLSTCM